MKIKGFVFMALVVCTVFLFSSFLPTPVIAADKYNWKMTSFQGSAGPPINAVLKQFIKALNERTNGKVQITLFENTLGKSQDHWEMLEKGAIEMAYLSEGHNLGRVPVACILNLPFELSDQGLLYDLCDEWLKAGYLKEITDHFKLLFTKPTATINLFTREKKITKLEDFQGMKIRAISGMMGRSLEALGAAAVSMHGSEIYMNLSTGVIDGLLTGPDFVYGVKIYEIAKYGIKLSFAAGMLFECINKNVWDNLPKDLQDTIESVAREIREKDKAQTIAVEKGAWDNLRNKTKMEIYTISPEEQARWKKATSGIANKYLDEWAAKGYPVKEAYQMMQEMEKLEK